MLFVVFSAHLNWKLNWALLISCCPSSFLLSVWPSVCKLRNNENTLTKFQRLLNWFQPNLAQSNFGWRNFKFSQIKGNALFQGDMIKKIHLHSFKILAQSILGWRGLKVLQIRTFQFSKRRFNWFFLLKNVMI